jgi:clan AA aspartic protease
MGLSFCVLVLKNPRLPDQEPVEVQAMADSGAIFLVIPEHIRLQLSLEVESEKEITLADGSQKMVPYVGPIEVRFKNRVGFVGALVMGDQVLLGAIPMEDMDLVVIPQLRRVDVNPLNPNFAVAYAKGVPRPVAL